MDTYHAPLDATEPPEVFAQNMAVGARIFAAGIAFFFVSFLFAFFYLRALNSNGRWNQHHLHPPYAWGIPILLCVLASVAVYAFAVWSAVGGRGSWWRLGAGGALLLGLAALGLQAAEYPSLNFGPGDGGIASVFFGWTGLYAVYMLGALYWLETQLAQTIRSGDAALPLIRSSAEALRLNLVVLGAVELAAFILLYAVR
jgi:heme/copper-type cytochrome/quinol oxidase subunit 3